MGVWGQRGGCCRVPHISPPPVSSLSRFCASSSSLPICAAEHQRLGSNPRGSPNPGDYPASFPPLPSPPHGIVLHSDQVFVTGGGGISGMNGCHGLDSVIHKCTGSSCLPLQFFIYLATVISIKCSGFILKG